MLGLLKSLAEGLRARRERRARAVLDRLKARYHAFRILLANNERALELIRDLDQGLRGADQSRRAELAALAEELLDVSYDLVDGLEILSGGGGRLLGVQRALAASVRDLLGPGLDAAAPACLRLDELGPDALPLAGAKAFTLARLKRAGQPVPDGFVITSRGCGQFLAASGLDELIRRRMRRVRGEADVEAACRELREAVLAAEVPDDLAGELGRAWEELSDGGRLGVSARSSALVEDRREHSFAGQFVSVLGVRSRQGLIEAFRQVAAGFFDVRPTAYRLRAGLPLADLDLAVLVQVMAPARTAGVLFTVEPAAPDSGRMLLSAVAGLGVGAVDGSAPADLYHPRRDAADQTLEDMLAVPAEKREREVPDASGGLTREDVADGERLNPLLSAKEVGRLVRRGLAIESLLGEPQDVEWALSPDGALAVLQARPVRLSGQGRRVAEGVRGRAILGGGVCASPGRGAGEVRVARSVQELEALAAERSVPRILVLRQSMVDAARRLEEFQGVAVDLGNPVDHLSCVARERGVPMLTGLGSASRELRDGQRVILDADRGQILEAPDALWAELAAAPPRPRRPAPLAPELARLRELIVPLNLTDAYGPTFSALECRSLHDLVRYVHEMAVLAMFESGDGVMDEAGRLLRRLEDGPPLSFLIIDLGGGLAPGRKGTAIALRDVLCEPLLALCEGMNAPGLRWREPPGTGTAGLLSRSILDGRSARPVGGFNYALATRDYLNLNARVDFHFAMLDAACGPNPRENHVRFRFKGGGTAAPQRERRAAMIAEILKAHEFFTDARGDLVTGSLEAAARETIREKLVMLGGLIGFTRLLDAAMTDDEAPRRAARAFLEGDYELKGFAERTEATG